MRKVAKSMTGFGLGETSNDVYKLKVEIKTVNHRYNEIFIRLPRHLNYLEDKLKKLIKEYVHRGKIDVYVDFEYIDQSAVAVKVDIPLAVSYKNALTQLKDELDLEDRILLKDIIHVSDVIKMDKKEIDQDAIWKIFKETFEIALKDLTTMKLNEGESLKADILKKLASMEKWIELISERAPFVVVDYREKLHERIKNLLDENLVLDEERFNTEIAYFADKSSIDEEIVRLESHIHQFHDILEENGSIGRKIDFLIQEMNREINTIGSKANDIILSKYVVEVKSELEKIREQIQNIE